MTSRTLRKSRLVVLGGCAAVLLLIGQLVAPSLAQVPPASPSVGTNVPESYFGPLPSGSLGDEERLVGPVQLLKSGPLDLSDPEAPTITIPLYRGQMRDGRAVWYILTDTTDEGNAAALGLNFSPKLGYAAVGNAVRDAVLESDTSLTFRQGTVDFSPARQVVPGPDAAPFPPATATPGSVGDAEYSPLVRLVNQAGTPIYNAPVIAFDVGPEALDFCDGGVDHGIVHDRVRAICPGDPENGGFTVTIALTPIFTFAKPALYMSTEASDPVVAALDQGTHAPAIGAIPVGRDDSAFSAIERLFVTLNGPTGADNPQRQGLFSALTDGDGTLPPLHVVGGVPTVSLDYSPMWDINLGQWTQAAIDAGYRSRLIDEFQILQLVEGGHITGPDGAPYGSVGIIVNCPIVARLL